MTLRHYQENAIDFIYNHDEGVLFLEMGAGKTIVMAKALQELLKGTIKRVLVVAPKRVAHNVWPQEMLKWDIDVPFILASGTPKQRKAAFASSAKMVITNYENLEWMFDNDLHLTFDTVVFDEITRMKNHSSKRFKAYMKKCRVFKHRYAMTGTPTTQGLIDLYAQMYCLDNGKALGHTFGEFRNTYFNKTGVEQWDWTPKKGALDTAMDKMHHLAFMVDPSEYAAQLPPLLTNILKVKIPREIYDTLEQESIVELGDSEIVASNAGVLSNQLQQIANGFIYQDEGVNCLHNIKIDALGEIIESQQGAPLIVAYKYKADLKMLQAKWPAPALGGGVSEQAADAAIFQWNCGRLPLMYLQPQSAGHGLNLQAGGSAIAWYGLPWSLEDFDQTNARLRRSGQKSDSVTCHMIVAEDTVDESILGALERKGSVLKAIRAGILERQNAC